MIFSRPVTCINVSKCMIWKDKKQIVSPSENVPTIKELPMPTWILNKRISPDSCKLFISVYSSLLFYKFQSMTILTILISIRNALTRSDFNMLNVSEASLTT